MNTLQMHGEFHHSKLNSKKTHVALLETYHNLCEDDDTALECEIDCHQEVTNTYPPENFLYSNDFQNDQHTDAVESQSPVFRNIPFSVYEQAEEVKGGAINCYNNVSQLVSTERISNQISLKQSQNVDDVSKSTTCYASSHAPSPPTYLASVQSSASVSPSHREFRSISPSSHSSPFSPMTLSTSSSSTCSTFTPVPQRTSSLSTLDSLPYPLFSSSTTTENSFPITRQLFSPSCQTPPPQERRSTNNLRPNSIRSQSFSSSTSSPIPSSLKSSSLSSLSPLMSSLSNEKISNPTISNDMKQHPTVHSLLSSINSYNQENQFNCSIQNNERNGLTSETFAMDNNNFNKTNQQSFANPEENVHYTDLDRLGEISFYDDLTSGNFKEPKQEIIDQSPIISSSSSSSSIALSEEQLEGVIKAMKNDLEKDRQCLNLDMDPKCWTPADVVKWVKFVCENSRVTDISNKFGAFNGAALCNLTLEGFESHFGSSSSFVHRELELWSSVTACDYNAASSLADGFLTSSVSPTPSYMSNNSQDSTMFSSSFDNSTDDGFHSEIEMMDEEHSALTVRDIKLNSSDEEIELLANKNIHKTRMGRGHKKAITLWQFLLQLLIGKEDNNDCIRWLNKERRIFKIEDSKKVANLWGKVKNRPAMNYDKLSRSIRQYYKKKIIKKPEQTKRLVYQFCPGIC